jgi:hypothetical protein
MDSQLSPVAILSLLFMQQIMKRKYQFLVYHNGRLHLTQISRYCLQESLVIFGQIPEDQELSQEMLNHILQCMRVVFQQLSFVIDGQLVYVDWIDVVFAGEPGRRRTLKISLPDGQIAFAKYTGNRGDLFIFEVVGTNEVVEIPLANILDHTQPPSVVLQRYKDDLAAKKAAAEEAARAAEKAAQAAEEAARAAEEAAEEAARAAQAAKKSMADRQKRSAVLPPTYPILSDFSLHILFNLCLTKGVVIGFTLVFNHLFLEPLSFDEERQTELPGVSEGNPPSDFEIFKEQYNKFFAGKFIYPRPQPKYYPFLSDHLLQILYHLSVRCNITIEFEYYFNLLVFRLLSFGDQSKSQLPQLSEEEREKFEVFKMKYNTEMGGNLIRSKTTRSQEPSGIPENQKRLFEWYVFVYGFDTDLTPEEVRVFLMRSEEINQLLATNMATLVEALSLPDSYWTQLEHGVKVIQNLSSPMFHHLVLRRQ